MRLLFIVLFSSFALFAGPAQAWNAAGHRLVATIAWQQLSPASREFISAALQRHPDYAHWQTRARSDEPAAIFAEAATWPDDIRNDPRFHNEHAGETPAPLPGLPDTARHKDWHYVDLDADGQVVAGQIDRQIDELARLLRSTRQKEQISWALPWLIHLVADIHQPLHVGRHGDGGGNAVEIENPANRRRPFTNLHSYWDDLPGPPWLRGKRLAERSSALLQSYPAPKQGQVRDWRDESHRLLARAYPPETGSLLPIASDSFQQQTQAIADQRLSAAGYRLGRLLTTIVRARVSRETP